MRSDDLVIAEFAAELAEAHADHEDALVEAILYRQCFLDCLILLHEAGVREQGLEWRLAGATTRLKQLAGMAPWHEGDEDAA